MNEFELFYRCQDNGDGSVSVRFHSTDEEAERAEEEEIENGGNGWGESSVNSINLVVQEGKLFIRKYHENPETKKYEYMLLPVSQK